MLRRAIFILAAPGHPSFLLRRAFLIFRDGVLYGLSYDTLHGMGASHAKSKKKTPPVAQLPVSLERPYESNTVVQTFFFLPKKKLR
jgi:hypothetical protein